MSQADSIHIGFLTTGNADRPHYPNLKKLLPPEVSLAFGGIGLTGRSESDLGGKAAQVVQRATEFVTNLGVQGVIISGAPLAVFNPGLEAQVSRVLPVPIVTPLSAAATALKAFSVRKLILITPFAQLVNTRIRNHLNDIGLEVLPCPLLEDQATDAAKNIAPEDLFTRVKSVYTQAPNADAIYFQGASLDPIPVIQKLEDQLGVPVIASNPAMLWCLFSRLGYQYPVDGFGRLLSSWPPARS